MADDYKCTLDETYLKKAKDELHEDPKNRLGAVETFRSWILSQSHLKCPTDTAYLLRFLRVAKFSQLVAREFLTNYVKLVVERPEYLADIDTTDVKVQAFLSSGYMLFPEKKDPQGRQIGIMRPGLLDPEFKTYDKQALFKAATATFAYLLSKEEIQVAGFIYLLDLTGFNLAQSKAWTLDDMKLSGKMWNKCYPGRFKALNYYNHGPVFETLFEVFKTFMSKKMKDRITFHGSNMESVYEAIPKECLPVEYLPDDYHGPNAGTIPEIIENMKKIYTSPDVVEKIKKETDFSRYHFDESTARDSAIPQESFRRLHID